MKKENSVVYPHSVRELRSEILILTQKVADQRSEAADLKTDAEYWEGEHERLMKVPGVEALWLASLKLPSQPAWPEIPDGEGMAAPTGCEVDAPWDPRD